MTNSDFYVGYLPMPVRTRSFVRVIAAVAMLLLAVVTTVVATTQPQSGTGEWSAETNIFEGTLTQSPYPLLSGIDPDEPSKPRSFLLFASGKTGVAVRTEKALGAMAQKRVRIHGQLLRRGNQFAITLVDGPEAIEVVGDAEPTDSFGKGAPTTFVGEIIDPKCWLGAMNPGSGLVHKACAELCIRGGIPPCFVGSVDGQDPGFFLMTDSSGNTCNDAVAARAGSLVSFSAERSRIGTIDVLHTHVNSIADIPNNR
jgi:hypothetical protein